MWSMNSREKNINVILEGLNEGKSEMTKEKYLDYVRIQMSGVTNMFDVNTVCRLSREGLTKDDCLDIMKNYDTYYKKWVKNKGIKENIDEGFTFRERYGVRLKKDLVIKKDTLFYCVSINKSSKTVKLCKQDDKNYVIELPISDAQTMFIDVSGLESGKTYTLDVDFKYATVEDAELYWDEAFVKKYTKGDWVVFPKGTKMKYISGSQSGDDFIFDNNIVTISNVDDIPNAEEISDIFKETKKK